MFGRSSEVLEGEKRATRSALIFVSLLLLMAWVTWGVFGEVGLYEVSEAAWLEQTPPPIRIEAPTGGKVVAVGEMYRLGATVEAGDVLVQLDTTETKAALAGKKAELEGLPALIENAEGEIAYLSELTGLIAEQGESTIRQARAALRSRRAIARAAGEESRRISTLQGNAVSEIESIRKRADARAQSLSAQALAEGMKGAGIAGKRELVEVQMRINALKSEVTGLMVRREALTADVARLESELRNKTIVAGRVGRLARVLNIREGSVIRMGEELGTIVSGGGVKIIAQFPGAALSRLRLEQDGRMEIDRFPRLVFGTRRCLVASISTELEGGMARVELTPLEDVLVDVPFEHGMRGQVEVEVERVSPIELGLRTAGWAIDRTRKRVPKVVLPQQQEAATQ